MFFNKKVFLSTFIIFALCFICHFAYDFLPNPLFAIFFPVNESIWEHMKLIYTSNLMYILGLYFISLVIKKQVNYSFLFTFIKSIIEIITYLIIFLPLYYRFGEKMFISISLLFFIILLGELLTNYLDKKINIYIYQKLGISLFVLGYIIFGILTYNPPHIHLFFDTLDEKYGINHYLIK